jgi:hypothetical protein
LNRGQGKSLIAKLNQVIRFLDRGNTVPACNQLDAFINEVTSLVNEGILTSAQGQALISAANGIKTSVGC